MSKELIVTEGFAHWPNPEGITTKPYQSWICLQVWTAKSENTASTVGGARFAEHGFIARATLLYAVMAFERTLVLWWLWVVQHRTNCDPHPTERRVGNRC